VKSPPNEKVGRRHSTPLLVPKTISTAEARSKKDHSYKPLPTHFRHDGFNYRLIAREGNAAIYEQSCCGRSNSNVCYEIIRVKRREGFEINGRFVEPAEVYPRSESWGMDGFTLTEKEAAFRKFREIAESSNALAGFEQKETRHIENRPHDEWR
jgi:hypothetical protein